MVQDQYYSHHHHHHSAVKRSFLESTPFKLFICFLGIFVAYLLFGIAQESMWDQSDITSVVDENGSFIFSIKGHYGKSDKFSFIISLVLFQCIFNALVSKTMLMVRGTHRDNTPTVFYAFSSFTYLGAMLASNYALEFVSYPLQVSKNGNDRGFLDD